MGISSPPSGKGDGLGVILATVLATDPRVLRVTLLGDTKIGTQRRYLSN